MLMLVAVFAAPLLHIYAMIVSVLGASNPTTASLPQLVTNQVKQLLEHAQSGITSQVYPFWSLIE